MPASLILWRAFRFFASFASLSSPSLFFFFLFHRLYARLLSPRCPLRSQSFWLLLICQTKQHLYGGKTDSVTCIETIARAKSLYYRVLLLCVLHTVWAEEEMESGFSGSVDSPSPLSFLFSFLFERAARIRRCSPTLR